MRLCTDISLLYYYGDVGLFLVELFYCNVFYRYNEKLTFACVKKSLKMDDLEPLNG